MTAIIIDKKKYLLNPEKDYQDLQKKVALKTKLQKLLSFEQGRNTAKN